MYAIWRTFGVVPVVAFSRAISTRTGSRRCLFGDRRDARRQRGGEQRGLPFGRRGVENRFDVLGEAHVEHLVGFVEHDGGERVELQRPAADVIERAAGRGDDDVHAALERAAPGVRTRRPP